MPEINDHQLYLQHADAAALQRSSNQGWASRCLACGSGVKSEIYNACFECQERLQDVKHGDRVKAPLFVEASIWGVPENIPPAPCPQERIVPEVDPVAIPFSSLSVSRPRTAPSDDASRDPLVRARLSPRRPAPSSPYRTSTRGRPPNGTRGPPRFKGVRQRKGVRGFLVEIRPPKWKRTIWLGTYNTDLEAAGAYDAGIFYTNKKTKYNFSKLQGTFPPLPAQLRLENPDDSDEIKTFVQREARIAAQKVKGLPFAEGSATSAVTTQHGPAAGSTSASSEDCSEPCEQAANVVPGPMTIPMADEFYEWLMNFIDGYASNDQAQLMDEYLLCNGSFQHGVNGSWNTGAGCELKPDISLDQGLL